MILISQGVSPSYREQIARVCSLFGLKIHPWVRYIMVSYEYEYNIKCGEFGTISWWSPILQSWRSPVLWRTNGSFHDFSPRHAGKQRSTNTRLPQTCVGQNICNTCKSASKQIYLICEVFGRNIWPCLQSCFAVIISKGWHPAGVTWGLVLSAITTFAFLIRTTCIA